MTWPYALSWLTVLLPLIGALFSFIAETPRRAAQVCMTLTFLALVAALSVLGFRLAHYQTSGHAYESLITFLTLRPDETQMFPNDLHPELGVHVDNLGVAFAALIAGLSFVVQLFAATVLRGDAGYRRFFWVASVHTFGMLAVVLSPSLFQTWIGLGAVSATTLMLSLHWWQREGGAAPARRSFLVLLASDLALLFVLVFDVAKLGNFITGETLPQGGDLTVNDPYSFVLLDPAWTAAHNHSIPNVGGRTLVIFALLFIGVAAVRSALVPFTGWLTNLAEIPPPALALLGGSGLLGGAIVISRVDVLLLSSPHMPAVLALLGAGTAVVLGGLCLGTREIYRLALLSAAAQMSLAFAGLGAGGFSDGLFAAFVAAPSAALLFFVAGNLVRTYRTRTITEMGGAFRRMPRTMAGLTLWALAVAGGDLGGYHVLAAVFRNQDPAGGHLGTTSRTIVAVLVLIAMLLSALYAVRLVAAVGRGEPVRRRGFMADRITEVEPRLRRVMLLAGAATLLAALSGIPGVNSFTTGRTHVPGLTFSHWVYLGGSRQILAFDGRALAVAAGILVGGWVLGWLLFGSMERADIRTRMGRVGRLRLGPALAPVRRVGATGWSILAGVERTVVIPMLDASGEGVDVMAGQLDRLRTRRVGVAVGAAVLVALIVGAASALAASGHLPVRTR